MWPDDYHRWRGEGLFHAVFAAVRDWLARYPALGDAAARLAYKAAEFALDLAERRRDHPGWFVNAGCFRRWVGATAERAARRRLLQAGAVGPLLGELHDVARQLLCWHYADELTYPQIAAALLGDPRQFETARAAVRRAYHELCGVLQAHGLGGGPLPLPFPQ
jgi:hypothetical protein